MIIICPECGQVRSDDPDELTLYQFIKDKSQLDVVYDFCYECDIAYSTYLGKNGYKIYKIFPGYSKEWRKIIKSYSKYYNKGIINTISILSTELGTGRLSKFLSDIIRLIRYKIINKDLKISEHKLLYKLDEVAKL